MIYEIVGLNIKQKIINFDFFLTLNIIVQYFFFFVFHLYIVSVNAFLPFRHEIHSKLFFYLFHVTIIQIIIYTYDRIEYITIK